MENDMTKRPGIMIVDDLPDNLRLLAKILKSNGYIVRPARDGGTAITSAKSNPPDLILLDIMMPKPDGFTVCETLKADPFTRHIPIIFISALNEVFDKVKAFSIGGVDYITKPFHADEVLARVERHLTISRLRNELEEKNKMLQVEVSEKEAARELLSKAREELEIANTYLENRVREEVEKRERQKALLIQRSKLESLGKLAAGIAHEVNQPLAGISMGLDNIIFKVSTGKADQEYLKNKFEVLQGHIERIKRIIDHVRTFSREQTSDFIEKVNVIEVLENALSIVGTQYENHRVNITYDIAEIPGFVLGNKYKLEQVLLNLLTNAKDAVDEKEKSTGEDFHKEVNITIRFDDKKIYIDIRDNGTGIPHWAIDKVFDPFFTTKDMERGTGLGLSVSYGIVKEMKGDILIDTLIGEYTEMTVTLPRGDVISGGAFDTK